MDSTLTVFDYVRIIAMGLVFLPALFQSLQTWLLADMIIQSLLGLFALLFPHEFLRRQLSDATSIDDSHLVLMRIYGAIHVGSTIISIKCRLSRDESVIGTMMWSRVLGLKIQIVTLVYHALFIMDKFTVFFLYFVLGSFCLWLMATLVHLLKKRPKLGHYEPENILTWVIRTEFFVTFLSGLAYMAFPHFLTTLFSAKPDLIHLYITQLVGGVTLGNIWLSWYSTSFYLERDIRGVLLSRFFITIIIGAVITHSHFSIGYPKLANIWLLFTWFLSLCLACTGLILIASRRKFPLKRKAD